jgi:hypothetical protein
MEPNENKAKPLENETAQSPLPKARKVSPAVWVGLTLAIGIAAGLALSLLAPVPGPGPGPRPPGMRFDTHADFDVLLSTVSVALLSALVLVYLRTFRETRANFALGLVVVLFALLLESLVASPVLIGAFGHPFGALATFFLIADIFKSAAFAVFLYLSLQ